MLYILKSSHQAKLRPILHVMLRLTIFRDVHGHNLGFWGPMGIPFPIAETLCQGPISTIMHNFVPISFTINVISETGQTDTYINTITAALVSDKMHKMGHSLAQFLRNSQIL